MKIPRPKVIKLTVPVIAVFTLFACTKDTDLLADYVVGDSLDATYLSGLVTDDYFVSSTDGPMVLDVLANDGFTKPENVKIIEITPPSNGSVVINEDKTITYTPGANPSDTTVENPDADQKENQNDEAAPETDNQTSTNSEEETETSSESETGEEGQSSDSDNPETTGSVEDSNTESGEEESTEPETTSESQEESQDSFNYTVEVIEEDDTVNTQTGTVKVTTNHSYGLLKAFPTAYGAGSDASGGRGGSVYHVTNLNNAGKGSFRDAVSQGNRTVVFDVSGTIELTSDLRVSVDNLTIAGQTAPVGGITLTGKSVVFQWMDNLILRYIRFRPDWTLGQIWDAVNFSRVTNSIIDHVSVSWGGDEALSLGGADKDRVFATYNVSVQRTLMGESSKGSIIGYSGWQDFTPRGTTGGDFSVNQNMYVNISHRFPGISTHDRLDVINNVVHNWQRRILSHSVSTNLKLNSINNYWQRGCLKNVFENKAVNRMDYDKDYLTQIYSKGNIINGEFTDPNASPNKLWHYWIDAPADGEYLGTVHDRFFVKNPYPQLKHALPIKTARQSFVDVTNNVGANTVLDERGNKVESIDLIDKRYINLAKENICEPYSFPPDPRKYQHYKDFHDSVTNVPMNTHSADFDTDGDGMPDLWELSQGLDPQNSEDGNQDINDDGYTNLEDYLNQVDF